MKRTVSIIVSGKVQGVFFRQSTKEKARSLSITGEVSNKKDGTVHVIATGESDAIDQLIDWCKRGPERAEVEGVEVREEEEVVFESFLIV